MMIIHKSNSLNNIISTSSNKFNLKKVNKEKFNKYIKQNSEKSKDKLLKIFFNNKYYSSNIPIKKGMKENKLILGNYKNYKKNKRQIESSLLGSNITLYQRIQKIVRFWGGVCNYSYPKFELQKFNLQKKDFVKNKNKNNLFLNKSDILKLPKLYTNSNISFSSKSNLESNNENKNDVFDILTKTYKDSFL
jgi:hypothetical protein